MIVLSHFFDGMVKGLAAEAFSKQATMTFQNSSTFGKEMRI